VKPFATTLVFRACLVAVASSVVVSTSTADPARPTASAVLHSVQVTLPTGATAFPPGPGSDLANQHCLICHSTGMVLRQPPLSFNEWKAEVAKMRAAYGAPLSVEDIEPIAKYLTSINGKP
jgi:cytochrome c5